VDEAATSSTGSTPRLWLRRLSVRDFRNLERLDLDLPPDGIAVVGENGHGKTNLLEAVYYLQLLRSVRGARDQDLVRFGTPGFHVAARFEAVGTGGAHGQPHEVSVGFERAGKRKRARRDGAEPPRLSDALGALPSVIFSPTDVQLVAGAPSERRRFLDVALALTSRRYLSALQHYRGALARRNAALRDAARRPSATAGDARAAVWEPALAEHGAVLWAERVAWVERWAPRFAELGAAIGERGRARMRYASALVAPVDADVARRADILAIALAEKRALDVKRGITHAGPHRDDLDLQLRGAEGTPRDLRLFGSAGQQRTAAIALRMLEAATLRDATGVAPLFLLDDPFAELDARRAHRILELLSSSGLGQTLLVVPRAADIPPELTRLERWEIEDGVLRRDAGRGARDAGRVGDID
jgi:DNA replication and repair protein RecF